MILRIGIDGNGVLSIQTGGAVRVTDVDVAFGIGSDENALRASPWDGFAGSGASEARWTFSRAVRDEVGALARLEVRQEGDVAWVSVELERDLHGLAVADSFDQSRVAAPRLSIPPGLRALSVSYGLGRSGEGQIGGYWPAGHSSASQSLPSGACAPLVLHDRHAALAIAPANLFLTSALLPTQGGIARTLHGSVDALPEGTRIETALAAGQSVEEALWRLGDALLGRAGKARPSPNDSPLTSTLGWWNAYGGYYTEPIRPLGESRLVEVIEVLRRQAVPIGYVGLDLWYPYRVIGQALRFAPDRRKYARGFREIAEQSGLGFVLHLSALSADNEYRTSGDDASFYTEVAAEIRRQGGIAAWHDWLRTQQHLTPTLRSDPAAAERWFGGMSTALEREGLDLLLCMQTMGMVLAATARPNIVAARTAIDYLFGQPEALDTLETLGLGGFKADATPIGQLRRQNLLLGSVLQSLGLLPFHDLFLTRPQEGLGGASPRAEAVLRALSCGPVGIGDGPAGTDTDLIASLVSRRGKLLHPDHAPFPTPDSLGLDVEIYETARVADAERWRYVVALNTSARAASFSVPHEREEAVIWDALGRRIVPTMEGALAPGEIAYYVVAPLRGGIAPIGLTDKLVPAPAGVLTSAEADGVWRLALDAPGERFAFWSKETPEVRADGRHVLPTRRESDLWIVEVPQAASLSVAAGR